MNDAPDWTSIQLDIIREKKKTLNMNNLADVFFEINRVYLNASQTVDLENFLELIKSGIDIKINENECLDGLNNTNKILSYFNSLLTEELNDQENMLNKRWLDDELINGMQKFINFLQSYYKIEYKRFLKLLHSTLELSLNEFFMKQTKDAMTNVDLNQLINSLDELKHKVKNNDDFETFSDNVLSKIFSAENLEKINSNSKPLIRFVGNFPNNDDFKEKNWLIINGFSNFDLLERLIATVEKMSSESFFEITPEGVLTYSGHFLKMSTFLDHLNKTKKKDIKLIRIFTTHSFVFDEDFNMPNKKFAFRSHSPDLILISPKVNFTKYVNIDLSCDEKQQGYPKNKQKAKNGQYYGQDGDQGEDGEPGFNGGNFVMISNIIFNSSYLNFISLAGYGGPGQNGEYYLTILNKKELY